MAELLLTRVNQTLHLHLDGITTTVAWSAVTPTASTGKDLWLDAETYGRSLFDTAFSDAALRERLGNLPDGERLLLVTEDAAVATVPWEYLRDPDNLLLAGRLSLLRGVPEGKRRAAPDLDGPLHLIGVPVSPADEPNPLNTEGEWLRLVESAQTAQKAMRLTRVRPPSLTQLEQTLDGDPAIVHFMGHSSSDHGRSVLLFEDGRARRFLVDAADFHSRLDDSVFLVLLNSCLSAVAYDWTEFGNIARGLVQRGVPYALGMQFSLPDAAALELSKTFFNFLLGGRSVEEALRRTRRVLAQANLPAGIPAAWVAGIPALYTCLREPLPAIRLSAGAPDIRPDPNRLATNLQLSAISPAKHFVGRSTEIPEILDALLQPRREKAVVILYGVGGTGKTALAYEVASRAAYHYNDRVLVESFEGFARLESDGKVNIVLTFVAGFLRRLAGFYGLDLSDTQRYADAKTVMQDILARRTQSRDLLVLDNIETLIDALARAPDAATLQLATFVSRLREGAGDVLLTTRALPPADWGARQVIPIEGLDDDAGAALFLASLSEDRRSAAALKQERRQLNQRVVGHPLSIRLLAARFDELAVDLNTFLSGIEDALQQAEQNTPESLEDPDRQRTLYACVAYSVNRLNAEEKRVLRIAALFQSPFTPEFAAHVFADTPATQANPPADVASSLLRLTRLSLLDALQNTFGDGTLQRLELHPMLRWYIRRAMPVLSDSEQQCYAMLYERLARDVYQPESDYSRKTSYRYLIQNSLGDFDQALTLLPDRQQSNLAYHLADLYDTLGLPSRAYELLNLSLATKKALNEPREIAVTQGRIADLLVKMGQPKEAMALYEESLATSKALNEPRSIAVTQANYAQVLLLNDEPGRAIQMLWEAYLGIRQVAFRPDIEGMQQLLVGAKTHLGSDQFDDLWRAHIQQTQPEWLQHALDSPNDTSSASDPAPANLLGEQLNTVVNNTVAVMTVATDQREQWWQAVTEANTRARAAGVSAIATFNDAVLALLEGSQPELPADNPHYAAWQQILAGIAAGGLPTQLVQPSNAPTQDTDAAAIVQAISAFVNSEDWDAGQQIVQAQSVLLFRPEVAQIFEQNITQARTAGNDDWAKTLRTHLQVLQAAQQHGIAETFAQLKGSAAPQPSEEPDPVDDALLETLTNNTAAVLGPVVDRRSQWRGQLVSLRNAGVAQGRSDFVALLDAHLALLDAEGDPTGLGVGLVDRYAVAWQQLCAILADDSG